MLDTPKHGWSNISIGSWHDRCSYLDDMPVVLLNALRRFLTAKLPVAAKFDAEGYEYILVFDFGVVHIISDDEDGDKYQLSSQEVSIPALAKELVEDIRRDIDAWADWQNYEVQTKEALARRKQLLVDLCGELSALI